MHSLQLLPCLAEQAFQLDQLTLNFRAYPWASEDDGFFKAIMAGRIQPYALAGLGATIVVTEQGNAPGFIPSHGDSVGFVMRFGLGVDFYATENIVLSFEGAYALSTGSAGRGAETSGKDRLPEEGYLPLKNLDHVALSLGATYRF